MMKMAMKGSRAEAMWSKDWAEFIVAQRENDQPCEYGHTGCSNLNGGACLDELLGIIERDGTQKQKDELVGGDARLGTVATDLLVALEGMLRTHECPKAHGHVACEQARAAVSAARRLLL